MCIRDRDGSFHKILQIYDKCEKENGRLKNRHGITDLELTSAVDEEKMAQLGVFGEIYTQVYKLDSCENWKQDYDEKLGSRRSRDVYKRQMYTTLTVQRPRLTLSKIKFMEDFRTWISV